MENGNVIYNNIDSLSDLEKEALDIYENGTKKELKNFFEKHFEEQYDYSFTNFKKDLFQKAKGYTKIENKVFINALDEAFKQSSLYDVETYRNSKEIADKYFSNLGRTKEAQDMILDYIANDIDIDSDALIKANAKYFETQNVNHGLYAFPDNMYTVKGPTNNPLKRIDDNIRDIINDKQMEMSLSSNEYMIGPIGVTGKTSPIAYHVNDMRSHLEFSSDGDKRVYQQNNTRGTGTVKDIIESLERNSKTDLFARHDELIGKGLDIESLWVKEDFYSENQDYVHSLMQKYKINDLDIIHVSENTEKISSSQIEKININDINKKKKLTPQEAFNKYGPNDDRFYTSQGLDHKEQKEKINELNSKRKPVKTNKEKLDDMFINSKQYNVWNKRKEELIKEGIDIKDTPDFYFGFDTESGKLYKDLLLKKNNQTVLGFINKDKDSMFVVAHGTKKGKIHVGKNNQMTIEQLGEYLQENNLIPDGIKNIYTVDCYGGLQKPVQLKNGIIIQSSHTSDKPVFSKLANEKLTFLGLQGDAEIIPEVQKFQGQKLSLAFDTDTFHNARLKLNTDSNGQYYFGDIQPEESIKVNEEVSIKNTDNNIKGQISFIDDNGNIKQEYKLTPQEAFDKYGPNDDRFYTSQGLNPKEQKEKINELNSKRKSVKTDKEILDDISIKPEEYDKVENNFKDIANELENLKNTTEEIAEEVTENIQKELPKKQLTNASTEAIENNIKNIDLKKIGKIGAVVSAIGLGAYAIGKHNKNKKEEKQQIQYPQNNNYIDNSYAQQMASDISSYRYGKQMTGFIN